MSETYSGVCICGPLAGRTLSHNRPDIPVYTGRYLGAPDSALLGTEVIATTPPAYVRYYHTTICGVGFWALTRSHTAIVGYLAKQSEGRPE